MSASLRRYARRHALRALGGLMLACAVSSVAVPAADAQTLPAYQVPDLGLVRPASEIEPIVDIYDSSTGAYTYGAVATLTDLPSSLATEASFRFCCGTTTGQPDLGYVQTSGTTSGDVEVGVQTFEFSTGTYRPYILAPSDFAEADAAHGTFWLFAGANGEPELGYVQTNSYDYIAVHVDTFDSSTDSFTRVLDAYSDFPDSDAAHGTFQLFGGANGQPQLAYVQTSGTTSGDAELEVDNFDTSTGTYARALDASSDFPTTNAAYGSFWVFGSSNLQPELGYVQTSNTTSGLVEVAVDSYYDGSYVRRLGAISNFALSYAPGGFWQLLID
jgi:hypothetical protein